MKFLIILNQKNVPEWAECYYDYATGKKLIGLCRKATSVETNIKDMLAQNQHHYSIENEDGLLEQKNSENKQVYYQEARDTLAKIVNDANKYFYEYNRLNKHVVFLFLQFKAHEIRVRYDRYSRWAKIGAKVIKDEGNAHLSTIIANCHFQNSLMNTMAEMNLEAYRKITKKHRKIFSAWELKTPLNETGNLKRNLREIKSYAGKLETLYTSRRDLYPRQARAILGEEIQSANIKSSMLYYLLGLFNGFSLATIVTAIIIIFRQIDKNQRFLSQYRAWKLPAYIILYIWMLAITFYFFEKKRINYALLFGLSNSGIQSKQIMIVASILTVVFSIFFMIYVLQIAHIHEILNTMTIMKVFPITIHLALLMLGFIRFICLRTEATNVFLKSILKTFISIFYCWTGIDFALTWVTEQMISMAQVIADLFLMSCYFNKLYSIYDGSQYQQITKFEECRQFLIAAEIFALIIFLCRMMQCIKILRHSTKLIKHEIFIIIKCIYNVILITLSIVVSSQLINGDHDAAKVLSYIWIPFAIIAIIYSIIVDVWIEWGLVTITQLQENQGSFVERCIGYKLKLRSRKIFSYQTYSAIIAINFILRFAWIFTFCPNILYALSGNDFNVSEGILTLCVIFQLIRRGIWNVFRVQFLHSKNCEEFRIRLNYEEKQRLIQNNIHSVLNQVENSRPVGMYEKKANQDSQLGLQAQLINEEHSQIPQIERHNQQFKEVKLWLKYKSQKKQQIVAWVQKQEAQLQHIEIETTQKISKL